MARSTESDPTIVESPLEVSRGACGPNARMGAPKRATTR